MISGQIPRPPVIPLFIADHSGLPLWFSQNRLLALIFPLSNLPFTYTTTPTPARPEMPLSSCCIWNQCQFLPEVSLLQSFLNKIFFFFFLPLFLALPPPPHKICFYHFNHHPALFKKNFFFFLFMVSAGLCCCTGLSLVAVNRVHSSLGSPGFFWPGARALGARAQ